MRSAEKRTPRDGVTRIKRSVAKESAFQASPWLDEQFQRVLLALGPVGHHKGMALEDIPADGGDPQVEILTRFDLDRPQHRDPDPDCIIKASNVGSRKLASPGLIQKDHAATLEDQQCRDYSRKDVYIEPSEVRYRREMPYSGVCQ